jgi:hypothetical protein
VPSPEKEETKRDSEKRKQFRLKKNAPVPRATGCNALLAYPR